MKKAISVLIGMMCFASLTVFAFAKEVLHCDFDGFDTPEAVTNNLSAASTAVVDNGRLHLDGTYGLKLGQVSNTFTVSAMVEIESTGSTDTVFFKDMDNAGNKWTGVLSASGKPAFWTHGGGFAWTTVASGDNDLSKKSYITYVENNAVGTLYVNGEVVGKGSVASGSGTLYLGVTYWTADAVKGFADSVTLHDNALTAAEVMAEYEKYVDFENAISLPAEVITDVELPTKIASKTIEWKTSDNTVVTQKGKVTRHETDKKATLSAYIAGEKLKDFEITVLKKPYIVNKDVILSYKFDEKDGEIIHDVSGNGNHAAAFNGLTLSSAGAVFDGVDDYVKMPDGVLYGYDNITISMTFKPDAAQKHVFAYAFGNTSSTGYMFLNPSRPNDNLLRFAATRGDYRSEREVVSLPGIRKGEQHTVSVSIDENGVVLMYVDGDLVMDGEINMTIDALGETTANYIAKSLYESDPYFAGTVSEFTVYGSVLSETEIKALYGKDVEYADKTEVNEYIAGISFENGIDVVLDTHARDDVKIGVVVLDENNNVSEMQIVKSSDEISTTKDGTLCVFAFDEETNTPGTIYVKGSGENFDYEYTPGKIVIVSDKTYIDGVAIVAGYGVGGTLVGVAAKKTDLQQSLPEEIQWDFGNAIDFKLLYWEKVDSMVPMAY